jgi:hypothetical protein
VEFGIHLPLVAFADEGAVPPPNAPATMWAWITGHVRNADRVYLWPVRDEPRQVELAATAVVSAVAPR